MEAPWYSLEKCSSPGEGIVHPALLGYNIDKSMKPSTPTCFLIWSSYILTEFIPPLWLLLATCHLPNMWFLASTVLHMLFLLSEILPSSNSASSPGELEGVLPSAGVGSFLRYPSLRWTSFLCSQNSFSLLQNAIGSILNHSCLFTIIHLFIQ